MRKFMVGGIHFLPLWAGVLVFSILTLPDKAFAGTINPNQGPPGTRVTATGGFGKAGDSIQVDGFGVILANTTIGSNGPISVSFNIPANASVGFNQIFFYNL